MLLICVRASLSCIQVEYDSPYALLQKQDGYFKSLVDRSGDQATLYAMAEKKAAGSTH